MKAFTEHPRSVGESYWRHMRFALAFSAALLLAAAAATIHAVFPFMMQNTDRGIVRRLHARLGVCAAEDRC